MASAEALTFVLEIGGGEVRLSLGPEAFAALAADAPSSSAQAETSPWSLEGEVDWEVAEALRLLAAGFDDGRQLAVVAVRPRDAAGHAAESVASRIVEEGEPVVVEETFLSTEYDAEGLPRRLGLELWIDAETPPLRVAGDRERPPELDADEFRRQSTPMSLRVDGVGGRGVYEVLQPA
jgi:hypothetical protein